MDDASTRLGEKAIDVRAALAALRRLVADPDDTQQVFRVIEALSGRSGARSLRRFRRTATGVRVLGERRKLLELLADRERLERLPQGSLGRAYLAFLDAEGITAAGLVSASEMGAARWRTAEPDDAQLFADRMRDMHDLWHAVTGYKGDLIGEAALLAFSFAQTWNVGVGVIVALGLYKLDGLPARRLVLGGFARGLAARWLPAADWEALLPRPLADVRRELKLGAPPRYAPLRTSDARYVEARAAR